MLGTGLGRLALALAIPVAIVLGAQFGTGLLVGKPGLPEVSVLALQLALFGFPFAGLALAGVQARHYWLTATALAAAFWVFYAYRVWRASLNDFADGADIGLGLIMLAAPIANLIALSFIKLVRRARAGVIADG